MNLSEQQINFFIGITMVYLYQFVPIEANLANKRRILTLTCMHTIFLVSRRIKKVTEGTVRVLK